MLAQQLLIAHSEHGDLSQYISGYFDTTAGSKGEPQSYETIAASIGVKAPDMLFISDVTVELNAAVQAGMQVLLAQRPGNVLQRELLYTHIETFNALVA